MIEYIIISISLLVLGFVVGVIPYWYSGTWYGLEECLGQRDNMPYSVNCFKDCWYYLYETICSNRLRSIGDA